MVIPQHYADRFFLSAQRFFIPCEIRRLAATERRLPLGAPRLAPLRRRAAIACSTLTSSASNSPRMSSLFIGRILQHDRSIRPCARRPESEAKVRNADVPGHFPQKQFFIAVVPRDED